MNWFVNRNRTLCEATFAVTLSLMTWELELDYLVSHEFMERCQCSRDSFFDFTLQLVLCRSCTA